MSTRSLRWTRRRRRDDAGASAVEFALIAMVLFVLLFGILQYGLYLWAKQSGSHAVREGARRAAVAPECSGLDTYVRDKVGPASTDTAAVTTTVTNGAGNTSADTEVGDLIRVDVSFHAIDLNFPFIPFIEDGLVEDSATSRIEHVPASGGTC